MQGEGDILDQNLKIETLPPLVSVTVSTLQILAKQDNYADLLTLYMAYVEITVWQATHSIYASKAFMMKRLHWGENRVVNARRELQELGLIKDCSRHNPTEGKTRHYTLVRHILSTDYPQNDVFAPLPNTPSNRVHGSEGTSTTNLEQGNTTNTNTPQKKPTMFSEELLALVNRCAGRKFRVLPAKGAGKLLALFTLTEIEQALSALALDEWHKDKLHELSIEYLLRATTIDKFLRAPKKPRAELGAPEPLDFSKEINEVVD